MSIYIKHIPREQIFSLAEQVEILSGQIVSKTLAQNAYVSLTLFAFDKGEEISTHDSAGDAMVTVLAGSFQHSDHRGGRDGHCAGRNRPIYRKRGSASVKTGGNIADAGQDTACGFCAGAV